jgi:hypothetical protein
MDYLLNILTFGQINVKQIKKTVKPAMAAAFISPINNDGNMDINCGSQTTNDINFLLYDTGSDIKTSNSQK